MVTNSLHDASKLAYKKTAKITFPTKTKSQNGGMKIVLLDGEEKQEQLNREKRRGGKLNSPRKIKGKTHLE